MKKDEIFVFMKPETCIFLPMLYLKDSVTATSTVTVSSAWLCSNVALIRLDYLEIHIHVSMSVHLFSESASLATANFVRLASNVHKS